MRWQQRVSRPLPGGQRQHRPRPRCRGGGEQRGGGEDESRVITGQAGQRAELGMEIDERGRDVDDRRQRTGQRGATGAGLCGFGGAGARAITGFCAIVRCGASTISGVTARGARTLCSIGAGSGASAALAGGRSGAGPAADAAPGARRPTTAISGSRRRRCTLAGCGSLIATSPLEVSALASRSVVPGTVRWQRVGGAAPPLPPPSMDHAP